MTIVEFLLARIAEDEAAAGRGGRHNAPEVYANDNYGCLLVDPARILAECKAKRAIVELLIDLNTVPRDERVEQRVQVEYCVERLAAVYSDHPDYQQEWA